MLASRKGRCWAVRLFAVAQAAAILSWACAAWAWPSAAGGAGLSPARVLQRHVDWQDPSTLPRRYRNHCRFDVYRGRYYCANHCGLDYQFFYCSPTSFGCCHLGHGYCGWDGIVRCAP